MRIEMEFQGLRELMKAFENAASDAEIEAVNRSIVTKAQPVVKNEMAGRMPKSEDLEKSGRWNKAGKKRQKVEAHAADEIPLNKIKVRGTKAETDVGWTKGSIDTHFYVKFINWGTVKMPPKEFIYKTGRAVEGKIQGIAEKEYQEFLDRTVG